LSQPSLAGPRLRLNRADEHLESLYPAVQAYMSQAPYLIGEMEREGAWRVQRIVIREHPDPSWALLVSEVVHHLRSALDYLVWQLVLLNGAEPYCRNQFPIYTKRAPRAGRLDAMLRGVHRDHRARIEDLQPYLGGSHPIRSALAVLVGASNVDKHRSLHAAFGLVREAEKPEVRFRDGSAPSQLAIRHHYGPLEHGGIVASYQYASKGEAHVEVNGQFPIEVVFGEQELGGDTIEELRRSVVDVVEGFVADFPSAA